MSKVSVKVQPFKKKYRPVSMHEIITPSDKVQQELDYLNLEDGDSVILFGPTGSGKTSVMDVIAHGVDTLFDPLDVHVLFVQSSSNTAKVLKEIRKNAELAPFGTNRIFCFDEADNFTAKSQNSIRSMMTEFEKANVAWVFTTNNLELIDDGIKSRSVRIDMTQRNPERYLPKIKEILENEGVHNIPTSLLRDIADYARADIRDLYRELEKVVRGQLSQAMLQQLPKPTLHSDHDH